jgi:release factor glutamine methyltransferase
MNANQKKGQCEDTVWTALSRAGDEFRAAGVDAPRLTAEVLLAHVLGWERARIIAHLHDPLAAAAREQFRVLARRRAAGEPLQYLTGQQEFYGHSFRVTPAVLIPRPETEILVEKALALTRRGRGPVHFVDVGTGSGCIAIAVAHELPAATGRATDISAGALAVARENAQRLGVQGRIEFVRSDLLSCFPPRPMFDLILSNPPYVARADLAGLPGLVRDHEPHTALLGGETGLETCHRLIRQAAARLAAPGHLLLEVGDGQARDVATLIRQAGLVPDEIVEDLQGIPRCIVARKGVFV